MCNDEEVFCLFIRLFVCSLVCSSVLPFVHAFACFLEGEADYIGESEAREK